VGVGDVGERGAAPALPEGTVTFLFTDLEGSTRLLQAHPDAYRAAVARHHDLLRAAVEAHGGVVFETVGDAVSAAFARPTDAVAALAGQLAPPRKPWATTGPLGRLPAGRAPPTFAITLHHRRRATPGHGALTPVLVGPPGRTRKRPRGPGGRD
jgi:class 3 adenylate cyclase